MLNHQKDDFEQQMAQQQSIRLLVEMHDSNRISIIWFSSKQQLHNAYYFLSGLNPTNKKSQKNFQNSDPIFDFLENALDRNRMTE